MLHMYIEQDFQDFGKGGHFEKNTTILKKPKRGNVVSTQRILDLLISKMTFNHQNNKITYSPVKITAKTGIILVHICIC